MAMPQRDDLIEEIKRTDLLLEWRFSIFARAEGVGLPEGAQRLSREAVTRGRTTRRKPSAFVRNCAN